MLAEVHITAKPATSVHRLLVSLCIYGFLVYITCMLLYPVIFTGEASFCIKQDNLHQTYPFFQKLCRSIYRGYLPVWDANTFGGKSFAGEIQPGIFYPLNILWCFLFGTPNGIVVYYIDLLISLHFFICLLGMYKLARTLQLPPLPAIASALVFTFTSAVGARAGGQTGIFFGLALMPWSVYFVAKYYFSRSRKAWLLLAGTISGLEILAGHMQPFFHTMIIIAAMILFYEYKGRKNWRSFALTTITNMVLILLVVFLITLPQMYYAAEYLGQCYRSVGGGVLVGPGQKVPYHIYSHFFIIELNNLVNLFSPEFSPPTDDNIIYMGLLPLLLVSIFIVLRHRLQLSPIHTRMSKFLVILLLIGIACVLGYLTPLPLLLHNLPFVPVVRQLGRYIILISFSASLLAGLSLTYIDQLKGRFFQKHERTGRYALSILICVSLYWIAFQRETIPIAVSIPFLACCIFLYATTKMKKVAEISFLAVALICVDLYLNRVSFSSTNTEYFADRFYGRNRIIDTLETSYGKYRVAFDMQDYSRVRRNLGDVYDIQTQLGYGATYNRSYLDFLSIDRTLDGEVASLMNIKYVITDKVLDANYVFKDSVQGLRLYERRNYYPRIYWKSQLGKKGSEIEEENKASIHQLAYTDLYQKIDVECPAHDTLIIGENVYPGWKCYDNRREMPITAAKIGQYPPLFRSIVLDKGHHILEFKYNKVFYWF